ncbi:glycoside hydrolase domain-containing protein [uncultured Pedobacter sp.]|uniref:glycoside hydrolase domain-containing protein n=1 Tax=uncultured Pedobacter sp. TaxID=246139 RepID=UPI0025CD38ED|nr:glycoside hydrolase domain-containing protein [uncultured Pedobacter sp.]
MKVFASLLFIFFTCLSSIYAQDLDSYHSLKVVGQTLSIRGHKIEINSDGFLKQVGGGYLSDSIAKLHQILYEPIHFHYYIDSKKQLKFVPTEFRFLAVGKDSVTWRARSTAEGLNQDVFGKAYANGVIRFKVSVSGVQVKFQNISFHIPFNISNSNYFAGLGQKGNARPDTVKWNFSSRLKTKPAFWVGNVWEGLYLRLDDRPVVNNHRILNGWLNEKNEGFQINVKGGSMLSDFTTGSIALASGQELTFNYTIVISERGNLKLPVNSKEKFKQLLYLDLHTK